MWEVFLICIFSSLFCCSDKDAHGDVVASVIRICISACEIVFPVVKQVAPEGYMPPDSEVG